MRRRFTREEILAIMEIEATYGPLSYRMPDDVEELFFNKTGIIRKSGPLYMASWRIHQGKYDHLLMKSA